MGRSIITNLCIFIFLLGFLYGLTLVSPLIREKSSSVLSASTVQQSSVGFDPQVEIQKGLAGGSEQAKAYIMNMKVSDFISYFNRTKKMVDDMNSMRLYVTKEIEKITPHKKK